MLLGLDWTRMYCLGNWPAVCPSGDVGLQIQMFSFVLPANHQNRETQQVKVW